MEQTAAGITCASLRSVVRRKKSSRCVSRHSPATPSADACRAQMYVCASLHACASICVRVPRRARLHTRFARQRVYRVRACVGARHTSNHLWGAAQGMRRTRRRRQRRGGDSAARRSENAAGQSLVKGVSSDLTGAPQAAWRQEAKEERRRGGAKACWGGQDLFDSAMPASEQSAWNEMSSSWCCPSKGCSTALDTFMRNIRRAA